MRDVVIMHENSEWVAPLRAAFAKRGVEPKEWFLDSGVVTYDEVPTDAVYYNRMSASSHTRGHRFGPELTRMALTWLERYQATVVNGTAALYLEVCKLSQYRQLEAAGLRVPPTRAVVGLEHLPTAAEQFQRWPLIVKPNRGGKGLGVTKVDSPAALANFVQQQQGQEPPLDGIWLLQAYIEPKQPFITRAEFIGQQFVYTVQVSTADGFELCPADGCAIGDDFCPTVAPTDKFTIVDHYNGHPLLGQLQAFLVQAGIDVAGIEFIEAQNGDLYVYDVNTNTNYNQAAERAAGLEVGAMDKLAEYLLSLR